MNIEEAFGIALKQLRNENNTSQEKLALECDLDRTYISMLERAIRQPSLKTIEKLSAYFGIKPSEMLARVEKMMK